MGIAATTFSKARTAANFQAWVQEAPRDAAAWLKQVAQQTGNVAALTQLDGLDAAPAPAALGTLFTQLGAAQLGAVQATRAAGMGWQANGAPKQAPVLTGKLTVEAGVIKLATAAGTFKVLGGNVFGPGDISSFVNRVVSVKAWPSGPMPAGGGPPEAIVASQFAPGASPDFVSGRVSITGAEVYVTDGAGEVIHVTNPGLKATLTPYPQLGVVLPGPLERVGNEWVYSQAPADFYWLAGFATANDAQVGPDKVTFTLQMAHGHTIPCDMPKAMWESTPRTSRHYLYGHIENARFVPKGLTPSGMAGTLASGGTPTESAAFVELATPVEAPAWSADEAKFGM